jgi:hypothetical protein
MAYTVNEIISEVFETGVVGETFTTVASYRDGISLSWQPSFSEVGSGFYLYQFIPNQPGSWAWSGQGSLSGPLTINFEVDPTSTAPPPLEALGGTTSLAELVEAVALRSLDLIQTEATEERADFQSWVDVNNLIEDNAFFAGMELYIKTGANAGLTRRIANSDYASGTLSWEQPVPATILAGDEANLYNRAGLGHTYREYAQAINMVIRELANNAMRRVTLPATTIPTYDQPGLPLDASQLSKVCSVSYLGADGMIRHLRRNKQHGWWAQNGDTMLQFTGNGLGIVANLTTPVTLYGYLKAAPLLSPSDRTFVDPEWLAETAAGVLQNANPDNAGNLAPGQYLRNRADAMRGKMATPYDANCVSVG